MNPIVYTADRSDRTPVVLLLVVLAIGAAITWQTLGQVWKVILPASGVVLLLHLHQSRWKRMELDDAGMLVRDRLRRERRVAYHQVRAITYVHGVVFRIELEHDGGFFFDPSLAGADDFVSELATRVARIRELTVAGDLELVSRSESNGNPP